jgi:hypothetical protein
VSDENPSTGEDLSQFVFENLGIGVNAAVYAVTFDERIVVDFSLANHSASPHGGGIYMVDHEP